MLVHSIIETMPLYGGRKSCGPDEYPKVWKIDRECAFVNEGKLEFEVSKQTEQVQSKSTHTWRIPVET